MEFALHTFTDLDNAGFNIQQYSELKFGSDWAARQMGFKLADGFFKEYSALLLANRCVIIPSPFNVVENAATVLGKYFMDRLNELLVSENGNHVDWSLIHRKVSYIKDYGFLDKASRSALISNDEFYMNTEYLEGKLLIFLDDVKITGTHEDKIIDLIQKRGIQNKVMFVYYAKYVGDDASTESRLNFAAIHSLKDYIDLLLGERLAHIIIRPMKFVLGQPTDKLAAVINEIPFDALKRLYYNCLCEGYYCLPAYQETFAIVTKSLKERSYS